MKRVVAVRQPGWQSATSGGALSALRRVRLTLAAIDSVCLIGGLLIVGLKSNELREIDGLLFPTLLVLSLLWIATLRSFGLYQIGILSAWEQFRRLIGATGLGVVLILLIMPAWNLSSGRFLLLGTWVLILSFEVLARGAFRSDVERLARDGRMAMRTAILGTDEESRRVAGALSSANASYIPVGYVAMEDGSSADEFPVLGSLGEIESIIDREQIECVFLSSAIPRTTDVLRVSRACRKANVVMKVWADVPSVLAGRISFQSIGDVAVLALPPAGPTRVRSVVKRGFDLIVAFVSLVFALPLFVIVALAIRVTSRGPVFFRQDRVTKDGREFSMYKFRTMVVDPKRALAGKTLDLTKPFFKLRDDPRLTRVGRVLRNWSLDELPQLFNVLQGDMSMVGPRPLPAEQVAANLDILAPRHEVRCGITGWWQIAGRSAIDSREAIRLDQFYIENWSLGLDIYILLRTLGVVLGRKGAW